MVIVKEVSSGNFVMILFVMIMSWGYCVLVGMCC